MNQKQVNLIRSAFNYEYSVTIDFTGEIIGDNLELYNQFNLNQHSLSPSLFENNLYSKLISNVDYTPDFIEEFRMCIDFEIPKIITTEEDKFPPVT